MTGRARASQMVVILAGARRLDLELELELELELGLEHVIDVERETEQGPPIVGAEIELRGAGPFPVGARTDDSGRAHVRRLGVGPFIVTVRAPAFASAPARTAHAPADGGVIRTCRPRARVRRATTGRPSRLGCCPARSS